MRNKIHWVKLNQTCLRGSVVTELMDGLIGAITQESTSLISGSETKLDETVYAHALEFLPQTFLDKVEDNMHLQFVFVL
ncbi:hypothetical protein VP01_244g3 [Puccinia sorghi]|uniref:Uncharacterized protein n=1 Tax=Puccinia sorghi TaxID=27349 RepID=A0A0L6V638_9BASI|nr:hypothetical protein VP01_244g3 [Puccinia sorghi]